MGKTLLNLWLQKAWPHGEKACELISKYWLLSWLLVWGNLLRFCGGRGGNSAMTLQFLLPPLVCVWFWQVLPRCGLFGTGRSLKHLWINIWYPWKQGFQITFETSSSTQCPCRSHWAVFSAIDVPLQCIYPYSSQRFIKHVPDCILGNGNVLSREQTDWVFADILIWRETMNSVNK